LIVQVKCIISAFYKGVQTLPLGVGKKDIDPVLMAPVRINNYVYDLLINICEKCQEVNTQSAIMIQNMGTEPCWGEGCQE